MREPDSVHANAAIRGSAVPNQTAGRASDLHSTTHLALKLPKFACTTNHNAPAGALPEA
jgi:hypothetical protein